MALTFKPVKDDLDIAEVATVAAEIWGEYWPGIIGQEQTDYMVANFQSEAAISQDIAEKNYQYFLLFDKQGDCVGYTAAAMEDFSENPDDPAAKAHSPKISEVALKRLFISKIYLYAKDRGKHYASQVLNFYEDMCAQEDCKAMYLTVNIHNELGVRAYLGRGFTVLEDYQGDIGNGFIMDDHIMVKVLG